MNWSPPPPDPPADRSPEVQDVLSQLRLQELLSEVQDRISLIVNSRDQVSSLLESILVITAGLDIEDTLASIVGAAKRLVDARYCAIGVRDSTGGLSAFVYDGIDDARREQIGDLPTGKGVLGLLLDHPEVIRLESIADYPTSVGFPPGHPPMKTFLGAPVTVRGEIFGNIYLTEKADGACFSRDDEVVIRALAAAAGIAIENARLYEQSQTRMVWIEATRDLMTELLSGTDTGEVLEMIAQKARELTVADLTFIALPSATGDEVGELTVTVADGDADGSIVGSLIPVVGSTSGRAFTERAVIRAETLKYPLTDDARLFGPALVAPMRAGDKVTGVLVSLREVSSRPFAEDMVSLIAGFADQAALAMSMAQSAARMRELDVLADRDRIARDLHDHVIQRIFAAGLSLQGTAARTTSVETGRRLRTTIDDLQDVIQDIRSAIFDLHGSPTGPDALRLRIKDAVDELTESHSMRFLVRTSGPLSVIDPGLAEHVVAVIRESVSNAIQHSAGSSGMVCLSVSDHLTLSVTDDGVGVDDGGHRRGLANLESRAHECGGEMTVGVPPGGRGTEIVWSVPLA